MPIVDPIALEARARNLGSLNGMRMVLVTLVGQSAQLDVYFYNTNQLAQILASTSHPWDIFPVSGGHRVRAGALTGMLRVSAIAAGPTADSLSLTVTPIETGGHQGESDGTSGRCASAHCNRSGADRFGTSPKEHDRIADEATLTDRSSRPR